MSAGICGKRVGFEEIFGSSSKRPRCSGFGSPTRSSDFGSGSEDKLSILIRMFPGLNHELVESVLKTHNNKIEDAIESLRALTLGDAFTNTQNDTALPGDHRFEHKDEGIIQEEKSTFDFGNPINGSQWVDAFVREMTSAKDLDDARVRAARILEAFETSVVAHSKASEQVEHASLKEHLHSLLKDNQILKRAVAIQHERNLEQEEKAKEVQELKHALIQYQEQVRILEMNNYALTLHLQRAQERNTIPGRFNPDVF